LPSSIEHYEDYLLGRFPDYQPTNWDNTDQVNVITLWQEIKNASDEEAQALVELWRRIEVLLDAVRSRLEQNARNLQTHWHSPAGEEFLRRVGAALYSIEEWRQAAATNKSIMEGVATAVADAQERMLDVWIRYREEDEEMARRREFERTDSVWSSIVHGFKANPLTAEEVRDKYTVEARQIMRPLADHYIDAGLALDRGTQYRGPTAAATPVWDASSFGGAPAMPGGPALPSLPGALPPTPPVPTPGATPPPPSGPQFAGVTAPPLPTAPPAPPGPPVPPGTAVPPGGGLPTGVPILPTPPGVPAPSAPARPGQPASTNPPLPAGGPRPPAAPADPRQQLQGSSPRTGAPALPGRPNLRGATQRPASPAPTPGQALPPPAPGARTSPSAPSLTGRRGGPKGPTQAGLTPASSAAAGSAGTPLAGRRAAGKSATGRAGKAPRRLPNPHGVTRALAGELPSVPLSRPARRTARQLDGRHTPNDAAGRPDGPTNEPPAGGRTLGRDR
jgi:hypothetical protein